MVFRRRAPKAQDPLAGAIDPARLPPAYRPAVEDAIRARAQYRSLIDSMASGPQQERLIELSARVDAGVLAVWETARQAARLEAVVATLDPERVTRELKVARRSAESGVADPAMVEALTARFTSMQRLLNSLDDVRRQIPILEARLGTAVARSAELTLTSATSASSAKLDVLGGELETLVAELDALRAAIVELD